MAGIDPPIRNKAWDLRRRSYRAARLQAVSITQPNVCAHRVLSIMEDMTTNSCLPENAMIALPTVSGAVKPDDTLATAVTVRQALAFSFIFGSPLLRFRSRRQYFATLQAS